MRGVDEATVDGVDVDAVVESLRNARVEFAVLFGSRVRGESEASSDVDIAVAFPDALEATERFRRRNRIDAELQAYADGFVDVSDAESLPLGVVRAALRDGVLLVGDAEAVEAYRERVEADYEESMPEREREREEFLDRLTRGDV